MEYKELIFQLLETVKIALDFNSQDTGPEDIEKLTKLFAGALKAKFKEMDLEDVKKGIKNGLYSGDYTWVNARILVTWTRQKWLSILEKKRFVN